MWFFLSPVYGGCLVGRAAQASRADIHGHCPAHKVETALNPIFYGFTRLE